MTTLIPRMLMAALFAVSATSSAAPPVYPAVLPDRPLSFPADYGAHPEFRIEWWYLTGWLENKAGEPIGFQLTFFRTRPEFDEQNPSRFAPKQLLFAHAALSDPRVGHLEVEQRAARAGFGLAEAKRGTTDVHIDDWSLKRNADGRYFARVSGATFGIELVLAPTQAPMAQGQNGFSRKGSLPGQASYYYSEPQLSVRAIIDRDGRRQELVGTAWLDHEWSTALLAKNAVGWDWIGINLDDGGALTAFRMRDSAGATLWASANWRHKSGQNVHYPSEMVRFTPLEHWRSPRTGAIYPVSANVDIGDFSFRIAPLQDDQELDSRQSTGAVYWEGAVTAFREGKRIGRGYLELTGYFKRLRF